MAKIIGNTTATPMAHPDWNQNDKTKANYIENKPVILTEEDVVGLIKKNGSNPIINQIQADWAQMDDTQVDYIKNKPKFNTALSSSISDNVLYLNQQNDACVASIESGILVLL